MYICSAVRVRADKDAVVLVHGNTTNGLIQRECFASSKRTENHQGRGIHRGSGYFLDDFFLVFVQVWVENPRERVNLEKDRIKML